MLCLFFLLQLAYTESFAQSDWKEGYVVLNSGDTLHGMTRDRNTGPFGGMYGKVKLKRSGKVKKTYKARDIQGYACGEVRVVTLQTQSPNSLLRSELLLAPEQGVPRFFRVISEGPLTLYHEEFTDPDDFWINFIPWFKREGSPQMVRATQGIFGLKKKALASFFADKPDLVEQIQQGKLRTPEQVVEAFPQ